MGIGTSSPTGKLNIVSGSSGSYLVNLDYNDGTDGGGFFQSGSVGLSLFLKNASATQTVQIATAGDSYFTGGDVGIGTSSPSSALHVKGGSTSTPSDFSAFISNATFRSVVNHSNEYGLYMGYANSSTDACAIQAGRSNGTTDPLLLNPYGDNVGIGTNSPAQKLHVIDTSNPASPNGSVVIEGQRDGTANLLELRARDNSSTSSALPADQGGIIRMNGFDGTDFEEMAFIGYQAEATVADGDAPSRLIFGTTSDGSGATTEKMRLTSAGRLGLGTNSPDQTLHLSATNPAIRIQESDVTNGIGDIFFNNNGIRIRSRNDTSNGIIRFEGHDGSTVSEHVRIHSGGAVSIGTTTSSGKLFVNGNLRVDGAYKLNGNGNVISQSGTTTSIGDVSEDDLTVLLTGYGGTSKIELNDGFIPISTNGSERVRIDGSGHLMVGKTSVSTATTGVEARSGGLFAATRASAVVGVFNRTTSDGVNVQFRRNNTTVGSVSVTTSATTYNTSSDARLKDVTGYARGLKVINKLNPVAFNWKADGKADEGLLAQEVEKIVPNAVMKENDLYQMDYSKLVVHLVAGMQEQQEQIERLQADSHTPKGLEDMSGYQDLLAVIEKLQEEVKLLKGVN